MKSRFVLLIFFIIVVVFIITSCNSEYPGYKKTKSGLFYKFYIENKNTIQPIVGDIITVKMSYGTKDTLLFSTSNIEEPFRFPLDEPSFAGDIFEGLALMHIGDSASFIVSADSMKKFGDLEITDTGKMIFFEIKLLGIQSEKEFNKQKAEIELQNQETLKKLKEIEIKNIDEYINKNKITTKPSSSGLFFVNKKQGYGVQADKGKVCGIYYDAYFLNGDKLFSSRDKQPEPIYISVGKGIEIPGLEECILSMKQGGKAKVIIPSSLAYGEKGIKGFIPPYSPLIYEVELVSVLSQEKYVTLMKSKEEKVIKDYVKANNIKVRPSQSGLYYIETIEGKGKSPKKGDKISIHYTGMLLNGDVFDTSVKRGIPLEFTFGHDEYISGIEEGISLMQVGGKARLIIPSSIAFGSEYNGNIPPYSPLIFDVELIKIQ